MMNSKKKNKIIIVGDVFGMPEGYAATQRAKHIAMALNQAGVDVETLIIRPTERQGKVINADASGKSGNIPFEYTSGTSILSPSWFGRKWQAAKGLFHCLRRIWRQRRRNPFVILYLRRLLPVCFIGWLCRLLHIPVFLELCEWPVTKPQRSIFSGWAKRLYCSRSLDFAKGAIVISEYIKERVAAHNRKRKKKAVAIFKLPILCDVSEFATIDVKKNEKVKGLVFSANAQYFDLLLKVIDAFHMVSKRIKDSELIITGSFNEGENRRSIEERIRKYGLGDMVIFTGFLPRRQLLSLYRESAALLMPLMDDEQSRARFPTKMGDYLLSGTPIIADAVGEVGYYLQDGENCFLAENTSKEAFAAAIMNCFSNAVRAKNAAIAGRILAEKNFNFNHWGQSLLCWIESMQKNA